MRVEGIGEEGHNLLLTFERPRVLGNGRRAVYVLVDACMGLVTLASHAKFSPMTPQCDAYFVSWLSPSIAACVLQEGETMAPAQSNAERLSQWQKHRCEACDRTLNGQHEWTVSSQPIMTRVLPVALYSLFYDGPLTQALLSRSSVCAAVAPRRHVRYI